MNEQDIPIDIHYNKLLDWLLNRRHCPQQWQGNVLVAREKINTAIQDMPAVEEITRLLQGTYINYFHCQRIVQLLKETEDGSKNIFGRYSSQRMKDWLEIMQLYQKDGVYLAEAAQLLMRNVNYEIPALKRQIAKCQQQQTDCNRKEAEHASMSTEQREKFNVACRQMGIQGKKVKTELMALVKDMPSTYESIAREAHQLKAPCNFYSAFIAFTLSKQVLGDECVPLLKYLADRGNTTVYEWRTGKAPSRVEETQLEYRVEEEEEDGAGEEGQPGEIDWGDIGGDEEIDFDISATDGAADNEDPGAIDWGADSDGADVAIKVVDDSTGGVSSSEEGVALGQDALTVLDNTSTRSTFFNEILELQAFLSQRVLEMQNDSDVLAGSMQTAPADVELSAHQVQGMLGEVQHLVDRVMSKRMQDLFLIRSSPRYVDRLTDSLKKILADSEKMMSLSRLMVIRRQEALDEERSLQPKLELIRQRTKELQKQIQDEISVKYKNRRVNIMGEINTV